VFNTPVHLGTRQVAALASALAAACAPRLIPPELTSSRELKLTQGEFKIYYGEGEDVAVADEVAQALEAAMPRLQRWGGLRAQVKVRIYPSHDTLEAAVNRFDYPWLRAWARYDEVFLQSPRTWGLLGATRHHLEELLAHEVTHCLMYQRSGDANDWMGKGIPLWFREGMASWTAEQGYRRPGAQDLWRWLRDHPDADPVVDADNFYQKESDVVYGVAHRAFEFLVTRYGVEKTADLMDRMREGDAFARAFKRAVGIPQRDFEAEFLRYVRWEGWRKPERTAQLTQ
jgi:hypothetical protein